MPIMHTLSITDERHVEFNGTDISDILYKVELVLNGPHPMDDKLVLTLTPHKMLIGVNGLSIADQSINVEVTDLAVMLLHRAGWAKQDEEVEAGDPDAQ